MKRVWMLVLLSLVLAACSAGEKATEAGPAKVEESDKPADEGLQKGDKVVKETDNSRVVENDGYLEYQGTKWEQETFGLKTDVYSVSLLEDMATNYPNFADDLQGIPCVMIGVGLNNQNDQPVTADFMDATLVGESGKQLDIDLAFSEYLQEEMKPNTNKDGMVLFRLPEGTDIKTVKKMTLYFKVTDANGETKEVEAPITLS
ncbi:hypothetical protein [Pseudobacillus wudalianchiensis]|uniref:DUF4352 domain-containing protein n=1 Tax=Pseudobacillus wudalianchiensis TaxID=1743143 RepID=A0A1B9AU53_9BACI|nr:hypothetical protein [Bacillus wudalianchiensis]OCA87291.1 hypothetical protein A8F95_08570 [Bacillus wudalianchiensis]